MKTIVIWLAAVMTASIVSAQTYVWTQRASLPSIARMGAASFSIGNYGYTVGGYTGTAVLKETWQYDPLTNTWSQKADLPGTVRYNATGFAINNKGYVCLGWSNTSGSGQLNDLWEYDPANNNWVQKASFPGGPRYTASVFVIGTAAYVGLGYSPLASDFYRYEPLFNLWTQVASFPGGARQSATGFAVNGKGYVLAGNQANNVYFKDLWMYDPNFNTWHARTPIPGSHRLSPVAFVINNKVFAGLGALPQVPHYDFYQYNDTLDVWIPSVFFPGTGRFNTAAFVIGSSGYMAFGQNDSVGSVFNNELWEFSEITPLEGNINAGNEIQLFSNPVNELIVLKIESDRYHTCSIFNLNGKRIISRFLLRRGMNQLFITNTNSGIYFLSIESDTDFVILKFIKM